MQQTVLILGGSGRFGRNATLAFTAAGWRVRQFDRGSDDLDEAAKGADVIVAAWNPQYHHWKRDVLKQHAEVRRVALKSDCTVIIPGNVYVFGPLAPVPWAESTTHTATNPLGMIRRKMEYAYRDEGVKTIILRAGDYLDTEASGNWFDRVMAPSLPKGHLTYPGRADIARAWAYLPDVTRAAVELAERREELARFEDINFSGYTMSGDEMAVELSAVLGKSIKTKPVAWWLFKLVRPFMPEMKHMLEMRYLWDTPHWLADEKLARLLPSFEPTPVREALARSASGALVDLQINPDKLMTAGAGGKRMA